MPLARPASSPEPLLAIPSGLDPEFARVLRISDPGPAIDGPLTFQPAADVAPDVWLTSWHAWRQEVLAPVIAPALVAAARLGERGEAREIQTIDLGLNTTLPLTVVARSVAAGARLLRRLSAARGERWLGKLQSWHSAGETPAHFPVLYAGQSALFHLPLRLLLPGYAYWEWCAAMASRPPAGGPAPAFEAQIEALMPLAQAILSSSVFHAAENVTPAVRLS